MKIVLVLIFLWCAGPAFGQESAGRDGLLIRGRVLSLEMTKMERNYTRGRVRVALSFVNVSDEPIILLQPPETDKEKSRIFWQSAVALAQTEAGAASGDYIVAPHYLKPSVWRYSVFQELAEKLNRPAPPPKVTRILKPRESWTWKTTVFLDLANEADRYSNDLGWNEIRKIKEPLWMRVTYSIFPSNLRHTDHSKTDLGVKLQNRWKRYGRLWYDAESTHNTITTEPIRLEINK